MELFLRFKVCYTFQLRGKIRPKCSIP
jgi:hypothetical protein